jgi:glycosyl transferase/beta-hydroxylase protein BlmF
MVSILAPTRGRPHNVRRLIESVRATAAGEVEIIFYVDEDDDKTRQLIGQVDATFIVGPRIILSECWNRCAEQANHDVMMQCCDETVFRTANWDRYVRAEFDKVPDKILLVHGNDGIQGAGLATLGFIHRRWADTVGYFVPPYFSCDWNDMWLTEIADALRRRVYLAEVYTEHMHPVAGKAPMDKTHQERLDRGSRDNVNALWHQLAPERQRDVLKLRRVMADAP